MQAAAQYITLGGIGDYRHVWHYDSNAWQQCSGPAAGSNQSLLDVQHNAIVVDPSRPAELYAGADIGIWHSRDGGMTWETFSNGLPDAAVLDLKLQTRRRVLYAATHGRGVYTRTIDTNMALGVELYIRDTQLDLGRRPSEEGLPDPTQPGKTVSYTQSPDIKAVPPIAGDSDHPTALPIDFFTFVDGLSDTSLAATIDSHTETINNYIYVQIHNRGVLPANNVQVMLLYSHTTGDAPPLPADYPIHVHDGTPIQTAVWKTLGIKILNDVRVGFPQVAAFELSSALLLPATAAPGHNHYLLALIHSPDDHFTSSDTGTHSLCSNDRKVACKKIQVVTRPDLSVRAGTGTWANRGPQDALKAVVLNPTNNQIIVAAGATGIWRTTNGGGTWSKASPQVLNAPLRFDTQATSTLYGISNDRAQILKSVNGGDTWSSVYAGTGQLPAIATDPEVAGHVFAGGSDNNGRAQILRSTDTGATWAQILPDTLRGTGAGTVPALAVVPGGNKPLLAAIQVGNDGFIALSSDSGSTWQRVLDIALQSGSSFIAGGAATIYAGSGATLMRSTDGGGSWTDLSAKLPLQQTDPATATPTAITNLLVNAAEPAWVYLSLIEQASGQQSIFASQDGGETWCGLGHPAVAVAPFQGLALDAANRSLYAATASGIAQYTLQWPVQPDFRNYYSTHDGVRTLGYPISLQMRVNGYLSQYFEKGRLEDHQGESNNPEWQFMAGLLVDELHNSRAQVPIGGDTSTLTYASLHDLADPSRRVPPPAGYTGWGSMTLADGTTFIPFTADLRGAPGHLVLGGFWTYMNRADLFPGGWLHDIGLPISEAVPAQVTKNLPTGMVTRMIMVQAFQRTILTYDALNPSGWQIERANIGTDYRKVFPERAGP